MILTAHQPAYLPWLGYFDKILRSDVFVFLDTVQFEKNSFINRNKIKTPTGGVWLTVPVRLKGHIGSTIAETEIDNSKNWRKDHLKAIYLNYKKAPRFEYCYTKLEDFYAKEYAAVSELCMGQLIFWLKEIGVEKKIVCSSKLPVFGTKSDLIVNLCRYFKADSYISGKLGKGYLNENDFESAGIKIEYQDYRHPIYRQLWGEFMPNMGIVDFWMNTDEFWLITGEKKDEFLKRMG